MSLPDNWHSLPRYLHDHSTALTTRHVFLFSLQITSVHRTLDIFVTHYFTNKQMEILAGMTGLQDCIIDQCSVSITEVADTVSKH